MQFHLHGTYRYASSEDLSAAISRARTKLTSIRDDIEMRCFVYEDTVLTVNLSFESSASEWLPMFESLAASALEGSWAMGR
ncbi:MAG: hypothetical protein SFX73_28330 [Kofleriaceae bacterium]|nr:hypothetical protein [Kofleriaceae bacterium]